MYENISFGLTNVKEALPKIDFDARISARLSEILSAPGEVTRVLEECRDKKGKLDEKKAANKVKRWQAIAESAAKQSKRTVIPEVKMPVSWQEAVRQAKILDITLVPYENERGMQATREIMQGIPDGATIGVMIGPEGGFSPEEIAEVDGTMHRISLGRRILRTETAGLATLSMLIYTLDV